MLETIIKIYVILSSEIFKWTIILCSYILLRSPNSMRRKSMKYRLPYFFNGIYLLVFSKKYGWEKVINLVIAAWNCWSYCCPLSFLNLLSLFLLYACILGVNRCRGSLLTILLYMTWYKWARFNYWIIREQGIYVLVYLSKYNYNLISQGIWSYPF